MNSLMRLSQEDSAVKPCFGVNFFSLETEEHFSRRPHILDNEHLGFAPEPPKTEIGQIGHGPTWANMGPWALQIRLNEDHGPSALRPDQS